MEISRSRAVRPDVCAAAALALAWALAFGIGIGIGRPGGISDSRE